jgi:hypothetical protein
MTSRIARFCVLWRRCAVGIRAREYGDSDVWSHRLGAAWQQQSVGRLTVALAPYLEHASLAASRPALAALERLEMSNFGYHEFSG